MLLEHLKKKIYGEIYWDQMTRHVYAVDASIYEVTPTAVVLPKSTEDIIETVKYAAEYGIPIIPRGGATGIAGGCLGQGIIVDTSKYLNQICSIDPETKTAICAPGVIQDQLNLEAKKFGLQLGPETSTGNRATLGGMVATNAAGARYLLYGNMADHIQEVEMVLSDGSLITIGNSTDNFRLDQGLKQIQLQYHSEISSSFPKIKRRASGYLLDRLHQPASLMAASEGTLGIITKLKLGLVNIHKETTLSIFHFKTLEECLRTIPEILSYNPISVELLDDHILQAGRIAPHLRDKLHWLEGEPKALLIVEFSTLIPPSLGYEQKIIDSHEEQSSVWKLRKAGLGLLLSRRSYARALAFIEDIAISPIHILPFMEKLQALLKKYQKNVGIYGHVGDACLHIRPFINLCKPKEFEQMFALMEEVCELVIQYHGVLSGEHGDGLIRSWLNPKLFGNNIYQAFQDLKHLFDPLNLMNPGKIVGMYNPKENLRLSPKTQLFFPKTFLSFENEGGLTLAVDLCNGNGECRKKTGLMCPSYHGDNDEWMTTRARAQSLRSILTGKISIDTLQKQELIGVLDNCLECKGCKTECPSQIDMAKIKSEILFQHQEKYGYPLRSTLFAHLGNLYRIFSFFPILYQLPERFAFLKQWMGISPERKLPSLSKERFSKWWQKQKKQSSAHKVVLFNDTFNEFNEPDIGKAAVWVLQKMGFEVIIPTWSCCGRTLFSKGFLKEAKTYAEKLIGKLKGYIESDIPIVGLEPSCLSMLKDDYPSLIDHSLTSKLARVCFTFDEFVNAHRANLKIAPYNSDILVHLHCHQKALSGSGSIMNLLHSIEGVQAIELETGCCGLAGSYGYEKEHYHLSMRIGEYRLFPTIRSKEGLIIANGFSCRNQILHGTEREALHLASFLSRMI